MAPTANVKASPSVTSPAALMRATPWRGRAPRTDMPAAPRRIAASIRSQRKVRSGLPRSKIQSTAASSVTVPMRPASRAMTAELCRRDDTTASIVTSRPIHVRLPEVWNSPSAPRASARFPSASSTSTSSTTRMGESHGGGTSSSGANHATPNASRAGIAVTTRRPPADQSVVKRMSMRKTATARATSPAAAIGPRSSSVRSRAPMLRSRLHPLNAWVYRLGLFARVVVEPAPRLAPVVARRHHLPQRGRRREALLPVLVEHDVADRLEGVEAHEVTQRERAHRVVGPRFHGSVDLLDRAHALLVGPDSVEEERHEEPVDDEAGLVLGLDRELAELLAVVEPGLEGLVAGGHGANHLEQRHDLHRIEEVEADEAIRPAGDSGLVHHRQR